MARYNTEI